MKKPSANIFRLAMALNPEAAQPSVDWPNRTRRAIDVAVGLVSSGDPKDHFTAAMALALATPRILPATTD